MFQATDHVLDYVDSYLHDVLTPSEDEYIQKHCQQCRICAVALEEAEKRQAAFQGLPGCEASEQLIQGTLKKIDDSAKRQAWRRRLLRRAILPALAACVAILGGLNLYYLNLSPSPYDLTFLGQSKLWAGSDASLRVRVLHHEKHAGVADVPVAIDLVDQKSGQLIHMASFTTDAAGTGKPRFRLPDWPAGDYDLRVTARPGGSTETITRTVQLRRAWKLMLSSDRPVYQPGQTIHVRALTLNRLSLRPVAGKEAVFTVSDPKGNVIYKQRDLTSKFGICAVDCPLADEIIEGTYLLRCTLGDTESKLQVEVKRYVLPKFKVEVTTAQPWYQPGQRVTGKIKATYFFGKPVAGAIVDLVTTSVPLVAEKGKEPEPLQTLAMKTNDSGEATFEFAPLPDSLLGQTKDAEGRIEVRAAVTDSAGQKQTNRLSVAVAAQPLRIEVIPESGRLIVNLPNIVYVLVSTPDGKPVKARVVVSGRDRELVTSELGVASFEFVPDPNPMNWTIKATDERGRTSRREMTLACNQVTGDFVLRTDKAVYASGDSVRFTVIGHGGEPVFVDFIKDGQTILTESIHLSKGRGDHEIDLPPEVFGNIQLSCRRFHGDKAIAHSRQVFVRAASGLRVRPRLNKEVYRPGSRAQIRFDLTRNGAPLAGALSLAAVDEAVFSVLGQAPAVEESSFAGEPGSVAISPSPNEPAKANKRGESEERMLAQTARSNSDSESSGVPVTSSYPANVERFGSYQKAALALVSAGWILLAIAAGSLLYVAMWFCFKRGAIAIVHVGALAILVLITGDNGNLSNRLVRWFHGPAPMEESNLELIALAAHNANDSYKKMPLASGWFGNLPTNGASIIVDGSGNMGPVSEPPRVRDWFPETLLWRPELITDDQGRASLDLDLADSITTWRLTASAITADGRLGASQSAIKVFQPFFVDANLPIALTRGDEIAVPVVLYNYLDQSQLVELRLVEPRLYESRLDKRDWFKCLDEPVQRIKLKPREVRGTFYRLRAERVGRHELRVTAIGSGMSDAIKRQVEVVPDGRRVETVWNGHLDAGLSSPARHEFKLPANAIEGSARLHMKTYPSTFSQLLEGLDAIFQAPYGCFEQTSSTTYPNVLALDYLRRTKKSVPAVEAKARQYIHLGYQRLLGFEVGGGGFDWFGRAPANRTLTAYGLMEFEDMAKVHEVDPNLIERTRKWLLGQREADGSWKPEHHVHENLAGARAGSSHARLSATAYIGWAVFRGPASQSEASATRSFLLDHRPETITDPHTLALVANALFAIAPGSGDALPYLERLEAMKVVSPGGKLCWWQQDADSRTTFYGSGRSGSVETTALAALAFMRAHQHPATVQRALAWLVQQKDASGTWPSTQATVLALKALLAGTGEALGSGERRIEIKLNGKARTLIIPADQAEVMKLADLTSDLVPGEQALALSALTGIADYQVIFRYYEPGESSRPDTPLSIQIVYANTKLHVGDRLQATAKVSNRMKDDTPMVLVELPVPAGFTADAADFQRLVEEKTIAKYQVQPRAVQVYLRGLSKELTIIYHLHAQMPVDIHVRPARVYEYYNPERQGYSAAARLRVTPALVSGR